MRCLMEAPFVCRRQVPRFCTPIAYSRPDGVSRCSQMVLARAVRPTSRATFGPSSVLPFQYGVPKLAVVFPACADTRLMVFFERVRRAYRQECHSSRKRHPLRSRSVRPLCRARIAAPDLPGLPSNKCRNGSQNGLSASNCYCALCCGCTSVWRSVTPHGRPCSGTRILYFCNTRRWPIWRPTAQFAALFQDWAF
jgi:hypothetical protein